MRVRTLVAREHDGVTLRSGELVDVPEDVAKGWVSDGTAELEGMSATRSFEVMKSFTAAELADKSPEELERLLMARSGRMTAVEPDIEEAIKTGFDPADEPKPEVEEEARKAAEAAEGETRTTRRTARRGGARAETAATDADETRG